MKKTTLTSALSVLVFIMMIAGGCSGVSEKYYVNTEFISADTNATIYETADKNISWGVYQKEVGSLNDICIELPAANIVLAKDKEEFADNVYAIKDKLDILESEYALGYSGDKGQNITVTIDPSKLGLPVFALLNLDNTTRSCVISEMGDVSVYIMDFAYTLNSDGIFNMTVTLDKSSSEYKKLEDYIPGHIGESLYLKLGELTASSCIITEDILKKNITFTGLSFLGDNIAESDYEYLMEIVKFAFINPDEYVYGMNFPTEIKDNEQYAVPLITKSDNEIRKITDSLYDDVILTRNSIKNNITIHFNINPEEESDYQCIDRIVRLYEACEFDKGAYSTVSFTWPTGEDNKNDYAIFSKKDGLMTGSSCSASIEEKIKGDPVLCKYFK